MTKEIRTRTRIAMLVGLLFIVLFGLVLSELTATPRAAPADPSPQSQRSYVFLPATEPDDANIPFAAEPPRGARGAGRRRVESSTVAPGRGRPRGEQVRVRLSGAPMAAIRTHGTRRPATARTARAPRTYKVQANDTLIGIARKVYGRRHWREYKRIVAANRDRLTDEAKISIGQVLVIPPLPASRSPSPAARPRPAPPRPPSVSGRGDPREVSLAELSGKLAAQSPRPQSVYVVRAGDNLTKIARRKLGDGSREGVLRLYRANRDKLTSLDELAVGMALRIPARARGGSR